MGSKIIRPNKDFPIFGTDSQADELKIFGTDTESTDITLLLTNTNAEEGWASGVDANGFPALSWFNAVGHTLSYIMAYYLQNGIPEWVALQEYFIGSKAVASDGFTYVSKTDNNIGNTPVGDSTNWRLAFLDSANTVVFIPTADYHPATKKYVDETPPVIASTAEAQAGTDNTKVITPLRLREGLNAAGSAPIYASRGWVDFNGTGIVAINDSGNVSSISDNSTGNYTMNMLVALSDEDFSVALSCLNSGTTARVALLDGDTIPTASSVTVRTLNTSFAVVDVSNVKISINK